MATLQFIFHCFNGNVCCSFNKYTKITFLVNVNFVSAFLDNCSFSPRELGSLWRRPDSAASVAQHPGRWTCDPQWPRPCSDVIQGVNLITSCLCYTKVVPTWPDLQDWNQQGLGWRCQAAAGTSPADQPQMGPDKKVARYLLLLPPPAWLLSHFLSLTHLLTSSLLFLVLLRDWLLSHTFLLLPSVTLYSQILLSHPCCPSPTASPFFLILTVSLISHHLSLLLPCPSW